MHSLCFNYGCVCLREENVYLNQVMPNINITYLPEVVLMQL